MSCGKSLVLFGVGPGPVLCCLLLLPEAKRKSGWGICGSSAALSFCSVFLVRFLICPCYFIVEPLRFIARFLIRLTRLHQFSGASLRATSAVPEEKKYLKLI